MAGNGYCTTEDLLVGKIPLPGYLDPQKFVDDAGDEIDTKIGLLYKTPIDVSGTSPVTRVVKLLLKRINAHLASGRLLLSVAAPEEQRQLHAYAWSLVKEANAALDLIASGEYPLDGAEPVEGTDQVPVAMPMVANLDPESSVESFYDKIANPFFVFTTADRYYRSPD